MNDFLAVSLVVPLFNEAKSVAALLQSINEQTYQPAEIILVDGGSDDDTVQLLKELTGSNVKYKVVEAGRAMPGKGRNIGSEFAIHDWIAYTDAGIKLDKCWLENLVTTAIANPAIDVVFGNVSPQNNSFFEKCAAIAYVPPHRPHEIRSKSIASCLLKKHVWQDVGGFPDFRAAEDLIFMGKVDAKGFKIAYSYDAMIYWHLSPNLISTFKKFILYSKYNVWAGRQWDWHYGILKQYLFVLPFVFLGVFVSYYWFFVILAWISLRTIKRIYNHKYEHGLAPLINPFYIIVIAVIIITIDIAAYIGWVQAFIGKPNEFSSKQ